MHFSDTQLSQVMRAFAGAGDPELLDDLKRPASDARALADAVCRAAGKTIDLRRIPGLERLAEVEYSAEVKRLLQECVSSDADERDKAHSALIKLGLGQALPELLGIAKVCKGVAHVGSDDRSKVLQELAQAMQGHSDRDTVTRIRHELTNPGSTTSTVLSELHDVVFGHAELKTIEQWESHYKEPASTLRAVMRGAGLTLPLRCKHFFEVVVFLIALQLTALFMAIVVLEDVRSALLPLSSVVGIIVPLAAIRRRPFRSCLDCFVVAEGVFCLAALLALGATTSGILGEISAERAKLLYAWLGMAAAAAHHLAFRYVSDLIHRKRPQAMRRRSWWVQKVYTLTVSEIERVLVTRYE